MANKTIGEVESEISVALTQFEKEHLGRGPKEARTFILQDLVLVRLKGVLTPAEQLLISDKDGPQLVKMVRLRLIECSRSLLVKIIEEKTGAKVASVHTDISTHTGERIFVFVVDRNLQKEFETQQ